MPLDPYFSAGKLAWLLEHDEAVARARDAGHAADGHGRLVPLRPARRRLRHRPVDRVAHPARRARSGTRRCSRSSACPRDVAAGDRGHRRRPRHAAPPVVAGRAAAARALRRPAGRARGRRLRRAGPHRRRPTAPACSCSRTPATSGPAGTGGLLPTVAWRVDGEVEWALDGGVFTAGALLEWLSRDLGLAPDPPALAALAAEVDDAGGVRVLPALAGLGAPVVAPEARGGDRRADRRRARPAHVARAALEAIAWRVADVLEADQARRSPVEVLRVDGGLTRDPTLLQLQADAAGVPVERGAVDATAAGAAALAAVGAGIWGSTRGDRRADSRSASGSSRSADAAWRAGSTPSGASSSSARPPCEGHGRPGAGSSGRAANPRRLSVPAGEPAAAQPGTRGSSPARMCSVPSMWRAHQRWPRAVASRLAQAADEAAVLLVRPRQHLLRVGDQRDQRRHLALHLGHRGDQPRRPAASATPMWKRMSARR